MTEFLRPIETAPTEPIEVYYRGPSILLYRDERSAPVVGFWQGGRKKCWRDMNGRLPFDPAYWRPLPPPAEVIDLVAYGQVKRMSLPSR